MSLQSQLSSVQGTRSEEPNKLLGKKLADSKDKDGIKEIVELLREESKAIQADCLAVLEEIGHHDPMLIADFWQDFLNLLTSRHNRLVWSSMIDLALIADLVASELFPSVDKIISVIENGSVITRDAGIKTLAKIASVDDECHRKVFPYLLETVRTCRPQSVAQYAESASLAVDENSMGQFIQVLENRLEHLSQPQARRVKKVLKKFSMIKN